MNRIRRRGVLALPIAALAMPEGARAQASSAESHDAAVEAILAGRTPIEDGIAIDMPPLSENGNAVDLAIKVTSPMTLEDHVTAIHILAEKNPVPRVAKFSLTPRAGRAEVATRIRLATTQSILVLAETSEGKVHRAAKEVIVILGACLEGG